AGPASGARGRLPVRRRRPRRAAVTLPPASRRSVALVAIGAALLVASYPPFRLPLLSFVAVAPAVVLLRRLEQECHPRDALRWGFAYGFVTQGAVLYWLVVALWHFTPLSALGYVATIAIFGLWHGLLFWFVLRVRRRLPAVPLALVFPLAWTAVEWAVGHQGDIRFPWLGLGTSLGDAPVLVQWADLAGARGVTLWLVWCNVMLVEACIGKGERGAGSGSLRWRPAVVVLATVLAAWGYGIWRTRTPILAGGLHAVTPDAYYNAAFFYDSSGQWRAYPVYGKHYLVPVVERVPFVPVRLFRSVPGLGHWSGGFSPGSTLPLYPSSLGRFGVLICYESAFEDLARRYRAAGADFLVNITNDAWYGRTAGPYQHATHLVMRAIETRTGIARAANDGISEFVDPLGRTSSATGLEVEAVVAGRLRTSDVIPPYVRLGDWVGTLCVLATLGFAGALAVDKWRSRR